MTVGGLAQKKAINSESGPYAIGKVINIRTPFPLVTNLHWRAWPTAGVCNYTIFGSITYFRLFKNII